MKEAYTNRAPTISDIIPPSKKGQPNGFDYIIERTMMRPRDVIDYFNKCIKYADGRTKISLEIIKEAEEEYSLSRLAALNDEWLENYGDIEILSGFLRKKSSPFTISSIKDHAADYFVDILSKGYESQLSLELKALFSEFGHTFNPSALLNKLLIILYEIGVLGIKATPESSINYLKINDVIHEEDDILPETKFYIHPMYHKALKIPTRT
jgi:hypothetical protein